MKKEQAYYDEKVPEYSNLLIEYQKQLYHSPYRKELEKKIGPVAFKNMELAFESVNETVIPLMQEENALTTEYEKLLASAKIEWNGVNFKSFSAGSVLKKQRPESAKRGMRKTERVLLKYCR